jgi:hypothetical protein
MAIFLPVLKERGFSEAKEWGQLHYRLPLPLKRRLPQKAPIPPSQQVPDGRIMRAAGSE